MRISGEKINWHVAAGELLLIVVGILLALAIDSWAERRKELAASEVYLKDMVTELQADVKHLDSSHKRIGKLIESASRLLETLEDPAVTTEDPGGLLIGALFNEGITRQPAIWEEIQMTGALRLIPDPEIRSAIVSHYLGRAGMFRVIDANFTPAGRALRALAWDVMPLDSFEQYMTTKKTGVDAAEVMNRLRSRDNAVFLLKRFISTGTVARLYLETTSNSTAKLLEQLEASAKTS